MFLSVLAIFGGVFAFNASKVEAACLPTDAPSITVVSPNGGNVYNAGKQITVKWTSCNIPTSQSLRIEINTGFTSGGGYFGYSPAQSTPNDGLEVITIPTNNVWGPTTSGGNDFKYGNNFKISIQNPIGSAVRIIDSSDNLFTIYPEMIKLTSPMSGQLTPSQTVNITWTGGDPTGPVRISLITVSPFKVYTVLTDTAPNTGLYTWTIPNNIPNNFYQFYVQSNRGKPGSTWSYGGKISIADTSKCSLTITPTNQNAGDQIFNIQQNNIELGKINLTPSQGCSMQLDTITAKLIGVPSLGSTGIVNAVTDFFDTGTGKFDGWLQRTASVAQLLPDGFLYNFVKAPTDDGLGVSIEKTKTLYLGGTSWLYGTALSSVGTKTQMSITSITAHNTYNTNESVQILGLSKILNNLIMSGPATANSQIQSGGVIGILLNRTKIINDDLAYINFSATSSSDLSVHSVTLIFPENGTNQVENMTVSLIDPLTNTNWGTSTQRVCMEPNCSITFNPNTTIPVGATKQIKIRVDSTALPKLPQNQLTVNVSALNNSLIIPITISDVSYKQ